MKYLTRIRLINWHYLQDIDIAVDGNLYLFGNNETGKSSILDAIQFVLVANLQRVRFNVSAQGERSDRNLLGYVLCKVGEQYQRQQATAYVALEFAQTGGATFVIGVVVDARNDGHEQHTFFILDECSIQDGLFLDADLRPHNRREFIDRMRSQSEARLFATVEEYQQHLRSRLGQLNERFFDLFVKAFSFKPVGDIKEFVYDFVLDPQPLDIEPMQKAREHLNGLQAIAERVEKQIAALQEIRQVHQDRQRLARLLHQHIYLVRRAQCEQAEEEWAGNQSQIEQVNAQLAQLEAEQRDMEIQEQQIALSLQQAETALNQDALFVERRNLEAQQQRLRREVQEGQVGRDGLLSQLRAHRRSLTETTALLTVRNADAAALAVLRSFCDWIAALPEGLADIPQAQLQIECARDALNALNGWARTRKAHVEHQIEQIKGQAQDIETQISALRAGGNLTPPAEPQRLRQLLIRVTDQPLSYLYEQLTVLDDSWQDAIEGLLGGRRFDLLVPPAQFDAC